MRPSEGQIDLSQSLLWHSMSPGFNIVQCASHESIPTFFCMGGVQPRAFCKAVPQVWQRTVAH